MTQSGSLRQVVDWSAAVWAGLIAGVIFLVLNLILIPATIGGNVWVILRLFASIILGEDVVSPPAPDTSDMTVLISALVVHFVLSIVFALILAFITHRWGFITGVIVGALFGASVYVINLYTFSYFFPWMFALNSWTFFLTHVLFGAIAGGIYEGMEVEEFEVVEV